MIGIDPSYYLDEMSQDEVVALLKARNDNYNVMSRAEWEQTRLQCFYSVTAMGAKIRKPSELFKLPWDNEKRVAKDIKVRTREEALQKLQEMKRNRYGR